MAQITIQITLNVPDPVKASNAIDWQFPGRPEGVTIVQWLQQKEGDRLKSILRRYKEHLAVLSVVDDVTVS